MKKIKILISSLTITLFFSSFIYAMEKKEINKTEQQPMKEQSEKK